MNSMSNDYYDEKIKWLLLQKYEELTPVDYYRMIFPVGSFQKSDEKSNGTYKPNGILLYRNKGAANFYKRIINDDLAEIKLCINREDVYKNIEFAIISGCSYIGNSKTNKNKRYCHAIIIDLDSVNAHNLEFLMCMAEDDIIPLPTAIAVSGNGVHVAYVFENPIPLYKNKAEMLENLKVMLTRKIWNAHTSSDPNVQYQGLVQGYRMVGTPTKNGKIVRAFKTGPKVSAEKLISSVSVINDVPFLTPNRTMSNGQCNHKIYSKHVKALMDDKNTINNMNAELCDDFRYSLSEAKEKWPEWYEKRIIEKIPPGKWHLSRAVYDWWLDEIKKHARSGNRRRCIIVLAAFAQKCDIPEDVFEKDAYALIPLLDERTVNSNNPFTKEDVDSVIRYYQNNNLVRMTKKKMEQMTGIKFPDKKTAKHHKSQDEHLRLARQKRDMNFPEGMHWYDNNGRPRNADVVYQYIVNHPDETNVSKIARDCNVSRPTVYKYRNELLSKRQK